MGKNQKSAGKEAKRELGREELLRELSQRLGLESGYWDVSGHWCGLDEESRISLLQAFGLDCSSDAAMRVTLTMLQKEEAEELLPPVIVRHREELPLFVSLRANQVDENAKVTWEFFEEGGKVVRGSRCLRDLAKESDTYLLNLPLIPKNGYHYLRISIGQDFEQTALAAGCRVIICPDSCYFPEDLAKGSRCWGLGIQLPGLRSDENWGIGDFGDLLRFGEAASRQGAKFIGINPLHDLPPGGKSPYSPSSRYEISPLYIHLPWVPEYRSNKKLASFLKRKKVESDLQFVRSSPSIDYSKTWSLKMAALEILFEEFERLHLENETERGLAFFEFTERRGEKLRQYALHSALAELFTDSGKHPENWSWMSWPKEYQDPLSPTVKRFAEGESRNIRKFQYISWLAETQFEEVQRQFHRLGLRFACYGDVALGADPGGAENWALQSLYVRSVSLGAPPDALGPQGQVWGLPALSPRELRREAYEPFIYLIREQLRRLGALRLDHVMSLFRLFLVPQGKPASQGGYLRYPLHDLAGIVALESERNRSIIIGEDLGTVPQEVSLCMELRTLLSYKVFFFMRKDGDFQKIDSYPKKALVVTSTHDLPTLAGYLEGKDIDLREELGILDREQAQQARTERAVEIGQLRSLLALTEECHFETLSASLHGFLADSPSALQLLQMEDIVGEKRQYNLPGTTEEYPNWSRRYEFHLDEVAGMLARSPVVAAVSNRRN